MTMTKEYTCEYCGCTLTEEETYDFNGHIACEDCEDHLFVCDCCGEVKDLRDYFVHNEEEDEIICEYCAVNYYTRCDECGTYVRNGDTYDATDMYGHDVQVCRHCAEEYYVVCANCGDMVHIDNATYDNYDGEYYCDDCWDDNDVIKDYGYKPMPIFYGEDDHLYMGVELEIDHGNDRKQCAEELRNHKEIYLKEDGSLDNGFEIVSHPCTLDYHKTLWGNITETALEYGFESHDARTCGLHVHLDRTYFGQDETKQNYNIGKLILLINKHWDNMVKFSRRTMNQIERWSNRIELDAEQNDTPEIINLKVKDKKGNRYVAVNLCNANTVELRLFNGSLRKDTVLATLELCNNMAKAAKEWTLSQVEKSTYGDIIRIAETEYLEDYCERRGISLDDTGISVVKKCWNAIKGHGDNAKKLDIVHISTESVFYHQRMIDFIERSGEYLRVLGAPRYPGESFRVCYETDFQQHGLLALGFSILPEWIDMTIKENPAQRLRTLEIVAETF